MMKKALIILIVLVLSSIAQDKVKFTSEDMRRHNPLLPKLEPKIWKELLENEKEMLKDKQGSSKTFLMLADKLTKLHPLKKTKEGIVLGGIGLNFVKKEVSVPAKISYPDGMALELILCQNKGRTHETLFITETRPLHLEILLHMAGFKRGDLIKIKVSKNHKEVDIADFFYSGEDKLDEASVKWKFIGSEFGENYLPDATGEQIIIWGRQHSIIEIGNEKYRKIQSPLYAQELKSFPDGSPVNLIISKVKLNSKRGL